MAGRFRGGENFELYAIAERFLMKNGETANLIYGVTGDSWIALFCGIFPALFRKKSKDTVFLEKY